MRRYVIVPKNSMRSVAPNANMPPMSVMSLKPSLRS